MAIRLFRAALAAAILVPPAFAALEEATPESQGVSSAAVQAWLDACERDLDAVHGFVLVRHGKTIAEGWWVPFSPDKPHMLYSHSKSFTATGVGCAVDEGKLDLDERVADVFPDKLPADPGAKLLSMRVRDLLTMNTGMPKNDPERNDPAGDWAKLFFANPVTRAPGTRFHYDSCATYMLAAIVERKTGMRFMDYMNARVFRPLGITEAAWSTCPNGIPCGGWGLYLTTRSLAKFGQLYLDGGVWEGRRILSRDWVRAATSLETRTYGKADWGQGYGFQFWRCRHNAFRADGAAGQFTIVMPDQDALISIHAGLPDMQKELDTVWDHLLPAMRETALKPAPAAVRDLRARCAKLALKTVAGASAPGAAATAALGKTFALTGRQHRFNFTALALTAADGGWELALSNACGRAVIPIGAGAWRDGKGIVLEAEKYEALGGLIGCQPTSASGAWTAPDTFQTRIYLDRTTHRLDLTLTFDGAGALTGRLKHFGMGGGESRFTGSPLTRGPGGTRRAAGSGSARR